MIPGEKANFFVSHYDWLAAGVGVLALALGAAFYVMALGEQEDAVVKDSMAQLRGMKPSEIGVKPVDMEGYQAAARLIKTPPVVAEVSEKGESFLASERRVMCKCKKVIPGDVRKFPKCPFCGEKQQEEAVIVLDADGDGMADEWEKKYGLKVGDPNDGEADKDGDGFTNLEEYLAKTDPTDPKDHPDYLDSIKIVLPLKETYLPFLFTKANKIPTGWRLEFFDPKQKNDYGRMGRTFTATVGEEVGKSGFVLKGYEQKEEKRAIKGAAGLTKTVDVSEVKLERKGDGKVVTLVIALNKKLAKLTPVDVQATLAYERGTVKNFDVVPGSELDLNGTKYKVIDIKAAGKGAKVTVENSLSGQKRVLEALEQ